MKLSEMSIRRPVLASVMSLLLILIGLVSFNQLSLREYPRIDEPLVNVSTRLIGASSEVIESQVTKPLEDSIAGIDGVDIITSVSRTERSQITVRFKLSKDPDTAAAEVRDRVARVRGRLPDAADEPVIAKVEADATPTIWLAYTSETMGPLELTEIIKRVVKPRLQTVPGVADVQIGGDREFAMRPDDLARRIDHDNAGVASAVAYDARGVYMFVALETSREVAVLVDGAMSAGFHEVTFDAKAHRSGTYIYRLSTPQGSVSRLMTLLK
jgi:multidrug efflux pump